MSKRSDKMYSKSPRLERNEETGKMGINKAEKKSAAVNSGTDGFTTEVKQSHERRQMNHRHEMEMMQLHNTHESEHAAHDAAKGGSKAQLHEKHAAEHKTMQERHHSELKKMHKAHEKGEVLKEGAMDGEKPEKKKEVKEEQPKGEK